MTRGPTVPTGIVPVGGEATGVRWRPGGRAPRDTSAAADAARPRTRVAGHEAARYPIPPTFVGDEDDAPLCELAVVSADGARTLLAFSVHRERVLIGRSDDADIALDDPQVSREHALLLATERGFLVLEHRTRSGLWLGERRARHHFLSDGDVLRLGRTHLRFSLPTGVRERGLVPVKERAIVQVAPGQPDAGPAVHPEAGWPPDGAMALTARREHALAPGASPSNSLALAAPAPVAPTVDDEPVDAAARASTGRWPTCGRPQARAGLRRHLWLIVLVLVLSLAVAGLLSPPGRDALRRLV